MKKYLGIWGCLIALTVHAQPVKVGEQAPPLEISAVVGDEVSKDFYKGRYLVLDFWATWCAPCIAGFPHLNELSYKFKNENIVFAAISYEDKEKIDRFFTVKKEFKLDFIKLVDVADTVSKTRYFPGKTFINYQVSGIPTTVIIDPAGVLRWKGNAHSLTEEIIKKAINPEVAISTPVAPLIDETTSPQKAKVDSLVVGSFNIISGVAPKPFPGYSMRGPGMAQYQGEKIDRILLHIKGWHPKQVDTTGVAGTLPYVEFSIKGNKDASIDSLFGAAIKALEEMYGLSINTETRNYEVIKLVLKNPKKLFKNAAAFDEASNKSSSMPGKEYFVAVNYKWASLPTGILQYILPDEIFVLSPENAEKVRDRKFDFSIPIKDYETVKRFLKKEYGIKMKKEIQPLETMVFKSDK